MEIFFEELSNAYLFFTHQAVTYKMQAQQSADETASHQSAPGLIKLASIGKLPQAKKILKKLFVHTGLPLMTKYFPECHMSPGLIKASKDVVALNTKNQFLICVNISNNFLNSASCTKPQENLFGLPKQEIPAHSVPMHVFKHVINIIFHQNQDQGIPFLAIVGNLSPEFKAEFKKNLVSIVRTCIRNR